MDLFNNHTRLYTVAFLFFVGLSLVVAVLPAWYNQENNAPLPGTEPLTGDALAGKYIFIANGCVACHSQQVRNIAMDNVWGPRPNVAADYAHNTRMRWWMNTATLMGTERTGPDLTNIGTRLPSIDWHLLHLYNPRAVVEESIMPAYPWMFTIKDEAEEGDKVVNVPAEFRKGQPGTVVAKAEALQLVAYLQSLQQAPLPDGKATPAFLYKNESTATTPIPGTVTTQDAPAALDGAALYTANCQACHQASGEGLKGAFPALKGSSIVQDDNPEVLIDIILHGYNARDEYGEMPGIGTINNLTPAAIAAIVNHERSSWGNNARQVSQKEVEEIVALLETKKLTP